MDILQWWLDWQSFNPGDIIWFLLFYFCKPVFHWLTLINTFLLNGSTFWSIFEYCWTHLQHSAIIRAQFQPRCWSRQAAGRQQAVDRQMKNEFQCVVSHRTNDACGGYRLQSARNQGCCDTATRGSYLKGAHSEVHCKRPLCLWLSQVYVTGYTTQQSGVKGKRYVLCI